MPIDSARETPPELRARWGARIRRERSRRGLSIGELADLIGVARQTVSGWERGVQAPSWGHRQALAAYFGKGHGTLFPQS